MDKKEKSYKKYIIAVLIFIIALPAASFAGTALMGLSYLLPVENIREGMSGAASVMEKEGVRPKIFGSTIDNYTDSLMLLEASYDGRDSKKSSAMLVPNELIAGREPFDSLIDHYSKGVEFDSVYEYPRYWHGTIPLLKLLLQFLSYKGIRILNAVFLVLTSAMVIYLLYIRGLKIALPPYVALLIAANPVSICMSLQLSVCFYLMQIGTIIIVCKGNDTWKGYLWTIAAFFFVGIMTAFTDLLTYPVFPLGTMLIFSGLAWFCREKSSESFKPIFLSQIISSLFWAFGYAGMWIMKWVTATFILNRDVVSDAREMITKRTGNYDYFDEKTITAGNAILLNVKAFFENKTVYVALALFVMVIVILGALAGAGRLKMSEKEYPEVLSKSNRLYIYISTAVCGCLPFLWYIAVLNHSGTHYWMTNRALLITLFAILAGFAVFAAERMIRRKRV